MVAAVKSSAPPPGPVRRSFVSCFDVEYTLRVSAASHVVSKRLLGGECIYCNGM